MMKTCHNYINCFFLLQEMIGEATKEKKGRNCQRIEVSVLVIDLQWLVLEVQNKQTPGTHPPKNNLFSAAAAEQEQQVLLLLLLLCCVHLHPLQIIVFFLQCTCWYWLVALELLLLQEVIYLSQPQLTKFCGQFFFPAACRINTRLQTNLVSLGCCSGIMREKQVFQLQSNHTQKVEGNVVGCCSGIMRQVFQLQS